MNGGLAPQAYQDAEKNLSLGQGSGKSRCKGQATRGVDLTAFGAVASYHKIEVPW